MQSELGAGARQGKITGSWASTLDELACIVPHAIPPHSIKIHELFGVLNDIYTEPRRADRIAYKCSGDACMAGCKLHEHAAVPRGNHVMAALFTIVFFCTADPDTGVRCSTPPESPSGKPTTATVAGVTC